ncbi:MULTISPECIES: hypothetical protein [unclassified Bradyrhizobium]|uniref:hypothetical protein n=1 Tax=unclassified Bradyrhizobium TaxID=2631580 RepID=UPI001CD7D194|nr:MULTISPECIES: hypothetical protein [unclassified Bradyrhizobium]MCA1375290.1 hypothetical protein [Bradyrhizobium sp. IC4060]MCA1485456.1 hypothetical protein [Bradyrhizobium sp. IC4061]MCA1539186.1 hypothetical protein [Bradyrhizobium sp. NBAIM32]
MPAHGRSRNFMFQNHHILLQHFADHPVVRFLRGRFEVDATRNRMSLPSVQSAASDLGASPHTGGHLGAYHQGFGDYLKTVEESPRYAAALAGDSHELDELVSDVNALVAAAKYALASGHLFANTPTGMTTENANAVNKQWFDNWRAYAADHQTQIREMQETVDQFLAAGRADAALDFPLLSPTSGLSMAERIAILKRSPKGSPISLQFTNVGPVPDLPGLVPPFVNTRLPGFIPPSLEEINEPEGFTPSNPLITYGLPGFPATNPQGFGQLPPTTGVAEDPLVLKYDPATGWPLPFSERSPILDPGAPSHATPPAGLYMGAGLAAAAVLAPQFLPLWARVGVAGLAASVPTLATAGTGDGGVFSTGAPAYDPFNRDQTSSYVGGLNAGPWSNEDAKTIATPLAMGHRGNQDETSEGPTEQPQALQSGVSRLSASVAPEDVRRLARVNETNAGNVFISGSAPVPYLPSTAFDDRYGNWTIPAARGQQPQPSKPIGVFADEPSYLIPPQIFGVDGSLHPRDDGEEWFSRWIRPLLPPQ